MKLARDFFVFTYGFFSIAAQTLVFREFLIAFEGNDISVGLFFASWFFWVGMGAFIISRLKGCARILVENMEFFLPVYLPVFVIQFFFIVNARTITSVEHFALLPVRSIVFLAMIANAPLSLVTGMFFPVACDWIKRYDKRRHGRMAVASAYILEATGSLAGGVVSVVLLACGLNSVSVAFLLFGLVSVASIFVYAAKTGDESSSVPALRGNTRRRLSVLMLAVVPLVFAAAFSCGLDDFINRKIHLVKWSRLLPAESFAGSFQTAQAEYLYGVHMGQWQCARGSFIVESLPEQSETATTVALVLSRNPEARRILIVGDGIGLCRQFLKLDQIRDVRWAHYDNEYVEKITEKLPPDYRINDARFSVVAGDVRPFLFREADCFDIIIVNLPDITSSALNRYFTQRFYEITKRTLCSDGIVAVRVAGGANVLSVEHANLGASVLTTLKSVFENIALVSGEQSYFFASESDLSAGMPDVLKSRLETVDGISEIVDPDVLFSVYLPGRAKQAMADYEARDLPEIMLLNTDSRPLTYLYSLLLVAKQAGVEATGVVKTLMAVGILFFLVPVIVITATRLVCLFMAVRGKQRWTSHAFDSLFLAFTAGFSGISFVVVVMFNYQTLFGSLYLVAGLISSLFMLGFAGGAGTARFAAVKKSTIKMRYFLVVTICMHVAVMVWTAKSGFFAGLPDSGYIAHLVFAAIFLLGGLCTGSYFAIAAGRLEQTGVEPGRAGGMLEMADHFGACVGGVVSGILLLPVLGADMSLMFLVAVILANLPAALSEIIIPGKSADASGSMPFFRKAGLVMLVLAVSTVTFSHLLSKAGEPAATASTFVPGVDLPENMTVEKRSFSAGENIIDYCLVRDTDGRDAGYIFFSGQLAPEVRGFGGRMNIEIFTDTGGNLIDFNVLDSNETPEYLNLVTGSKKNMTGMPLLEPETLRSLDAVTGATVSFNAVCSAMSLSATRFFSCLNDGSRVLPCDTRRGRMIDGTVVYLVFALLLSVVVMYYRLSRFRFVLLAFNFIFGGVVLNAQFSSAHIMNLLSFNLPSTGGLLFLIFGVPLVVLVFGNIYCGYLCPFGALQELVGRIIPRRYKPLPPKRMFFVKYILLFFLLMCFFVSGQPEALAGDPLIKVFSGMLDRLLIVVVFIVLAGGLFYTRFWCLYLCPAGAFLSLLSRVAFLKKFLPRKKFSRCEFCLAPGNLDECIMCDLCLYDESRAGVRPEGVRAGMVLLPIVVGVALIVAGAAVNNLFSNDLKDEPELSVADPVQIREDPGVRRVRELIERKKLSGKEALFYEKLE